MYEKYVDLALKLGAAHSVEFKTEDIVFDARSLLKCMFGCTSWGIEHTCPSRPGALKPWEYETLFKKYKGGIIVHSTDKKISHDVSFEIERQAFLNGYHLAVSLSDCACCTQCSGYKGAACVNPHKARPAFHSVGIDVFKTVRKFNLPIKTLQDKNEQANWYSAVFID